MARRTIAIHPEETAIIASMLAERDAVNRSISVAVNMALARHKISAAVFVGLDGNAIVMEVPDDAVKLDRVESPKTGSGVVGDISPVHTPETPSGGQPAGNSGGLAPVVDVPDAGKPATDGGPVDSMGKDTGNFPNDLPGVDPELREHGG